MKALLRSDWYTQRRFLFISFAVFGLLSWLIMRNLRGFYGAEPENDLWLIAALTIVLLPMDIIAGISSAKAFSDSKKAGWLRMCGAMPCKTDHIIAEKALFGLLVKLSHSVIVVICQLASGCFSFQVSLRIIMWIWVIQLLISGLMLFFTINADFAGAIAILFGMVILLPGLIAELLWIVVPDANMTGALIESFFEYTRTFSGACTALGISIIIYAACIFASMKTYRVK